MNELGIQSVSRHPVDRPWDAIHRRRLIDSAGAIPAAFLLGYSGLGLLVAMLLAISPAWAKNLAGDGTFTICACNGACWRSSDVRDRSLVDRLAKLPCPTDIDTSADADLRVANWLASGPTVLSAQVESGQCGRTDIAVALAAVEAKARLLARQAFHLNLWVQPPGRQTVISDRPAGGVDVTWDPAARAVYAAAAMKLDALLPRPDCVSAYNTALSDYTGDPLPRLLMGLVGVFEAAGEFDDLVGQYQPGATNGAALFLLGAGAARALAPSGAGTLSPIPIKGFHAFVGINQACPTAASLVGKAPARFFGPRPVAWTRGPAIEDSLRCRAAVSLHDREYYPAAVMYQTAGDDPKTVSNDGWLNALCWTGRWLVAAGGTNDPDHPTTLIIDTTTGAVRRLKESPFSASGRPWSDFWDEAACGEKSVTVSDRDYGRSRTYPFQ